MAKQNAELAAAVAKIPWYHTMDLGGGVVTPGQDNTPPRLKKLHLPKDLRGQSVLDIGSWDGFYAFEAERRGAARVLATDSYSWSGEGWGRKDGFELARRALHSRVEDRTIDVMDLSPEAVGVFDLVLLLGVLYHLRHPLLALERVASVTGRHLILETHVDLLTVDRPAIAFYPDSELNGDATNWVGPNPAAVVGMLKAVGFRDARMVSRAGPAHSRPLTLAYRVGRALRRCTLAGGIVPARAVFHAWR